jgi:hypothetical protein
MKREKRLGENYVGECLTCGHPAHHLGDGRCERTGVRGQRFARGIDCCMECDCVLCREWAIARRGVVAIVELQEMIRKGQYS